MADTLRIAVWLAPLVVAGLGVGLGVVAAEALETVIVTPVTFWFDMAVAMALARFDREPPAPVARFV